MQADTRLAALAFEEGYGVRIEWATPSGAHSIHANNIGAARIALKILQLQGSGFNILREKNNA